MQRRIYFLDRIRGLGIARGGDQEHLTSVLSALQWWAAQPPDKMAVSPAKAVILVHDSCCPVLASSMQDGFTVELLPKLAFFALWDGPRLVARRTVLRAGCPKASHFGETPLALIPQQAVWALSSPCQLPPMSTHLHHRRREDGAKKVHLSRLALPISLLLRRRRRPLSWSPTLFGCPGRLW